MGRLVGSGRTVARGPGAVLSVLGALGSGARLLWLFVRLALAHELAYRVNFAVQLLTSAIGLATSLAFLAVLRGQAEELAGWRSAELLALWGTFYLLTGLLGTVVQPSLQSLIEDVRTGALDSLLTRPVDAQALISVRRIEVWKVVDLAVGVGLLAVARPGLDGQVGLARAAAFVVALLAGAAIVYGCCLTLATLAFWSARVENALILFLSLWETGRWPLGVYPPWLGGLLTFVVPVALATTVPAEALSGRLTAPSLAGAVALGAGLLALSRWLWLLGLRRYSGASG
jgi:ABC-2 type transport system permease protein